MEFFFLVNYIIRAYIPQEAYAFYYLSFQSFLGVVLKSGHLVSDNQKTGQVLQVRKTTVPFKK